MASSEGAKGGFATGVVVGLMISGVVLCLAVPVGFAAVQARRAAALKGDPLLWSHLPAQAIK
jgi:hypothetical protein